MINKFKPAFSLAEVMITMVVLSVVAMLTIPVFIGNYQEKGYHAQLKKSYGVLQNGFEMISDLDNDDYRIWTLTNGDINSTTNVVNKLKKYLTLSKDCGHAEGCFTDKIYKRKNRTLVETNSSSSSSSSTSERYSIVLNDGTSVLFTIAAKSTFSDQAAGIDADLLNSRNLVLVLDVNGLKGPNTRGVDIYYLVLTNKGLLPYGISNESANCDKKNSQGYDCAAKYIYDEK